MNNTSSEHDIGSLFAKKASIVEEVMRLRHEQAQVKSEIARLAIANRDFSLISQQPRCW